MTYSSEVLADSPIAYWRLGETSGTSAADSSGNARHATYTSSPTLGVTGLLSGDADKAVQLAADNLNCVAIASAAWMDVSTISVECLVKFTSAVDATNGDAIVTRWMSGGFDWYVYRDTAGKFAAQLSNAAGATKTLVSSATLTTGTAYHVAMTYDGATMTLYVDGVSVGSLGSMGGGIWAGARPIEIGRAYQTSSYVGGAVIDEVAIYGGALSAARVAAHHAAVTGSSTVTGTLAAVLPW